MFKLKTLVHYVFRLYSGYFAAIFLIIAGVLILSCAFDILQKFKSVTIPAGVFWKFVLYKVPYLLNETMVLISFISTLFFWQSLVKYNELLIILSSGVPFWRILGVAALTSFFFGLLTIMVLNPIGTYGLGRYEQLSAKLNNKRQSDVIKIEEGLLSFEKYEDSRRLIQARSLNIDAKELYDVNIIFIDKKNAFLKRIDAGRAKLDEGVIKLSSAKIITKTDLEDSIDMVIPTKLTISDFKDSLVSPEVVSFWELPALITKLSNSGITVTNYQIYYYKQLFKPMTMVAMIILASCFIRLEGRGNVNIARLGMATFVGIITYFLLEIIIKLLAYNGIAPMASVLLPIFLIIFISNFLVLHLQEA